MGGRQGLGEEALLLLPHYLPLTFSRLQALLGWRHSAGPRPLSYLWARHWGEPSGQLVLDVAFSCLAVP